MIRLVEERDREAVYAFFRMMVRDTWEKEGVGDLEAYIQAEIQSKHKAFEDSLNDLQKMYVLVEAGEIIGVAALSPCSELVASIAPEVADLKELSSVMIHRDFQGKGFGSKLVDQITSTLPEFCLDSGYSNAKAIWSRKFGAPYRIKKDQWGEGVDHYVWWVRRGGREA